MISFCSNNHGDVVFFAVNSDMMYVGLLQRVFFLLNSKILGLVKVP